MQKPCHELSIADGLLRALPVSPQRSHGLPRPHFPYLKKIPLTKHESLLGPCHRPLCKRLHVLPSL